MEKNIEKKNVIWNMVGASANAFTSLLFSIIVTRINGEFDAGIFIYCFATACLFYFIGNYSGRTFQVTDISGKNSDTDYIFNRIITCTIMILVTIIFTLIKGYDLYKSLILVILCLYKCIEAFAESLYAIVQKNGKLYKVGISMFLKAGISTIVLLIVDLITKNLLIASIGTVIVNIVLILIYDLKNIKQVEIEKTKFTKEANIRLFKIGFFTFILTFLGTYLINSPRYAIDDLLESNLQTIFGIIIMPASFMGLLGQYIIQPSLTKMSDAIKNKQYDELSKIIKTLILLVLAAGVIVFAVAWFLEVPVLKLVYGVELQPYFVSMMIIIFGSVLYSLSFVLSAILIAMRRTLGQTIVYGIVSVISTIMAYTLVNKIQIIGASMTYTLTMALMAIAFLIYTVICMKKYKETWISNENINNNSNI